LVGWLVGWLVGCFWLVVFGWLVGWLVKSLLSYTGGGFVDSSGEKTPLIRSLRASAITQRLIVPWYLTGTGRCNVSDATRQL
jgi:hypothetical protein